MSLPDQQLIKRYHAFIKAIVTQRETFRLAIGSRYSLDFSTPPVQRGGAWYCVVRLHDEWAQFSRDAVFISARGGTLTRGGTLIARSSLLGINDEPMSLLETTWKAAHKGRWPRFGPPFDDPAIAIKAANHLAINNLSQFSAGMAAATNAPLELKACRNFLAHRHQWTAKHREITSLRSRIGAPGVAVGELPAYSISAGMTVFEEWCLDLEDLAASSLL